MPFRDADKQREYFSDYYKKNRDIKLRRANAIHKLRPKTEEQKRRSALKIYGLTIEQYDAILSKQNGVCGICNQTCVTSQHLSVDHCHETGRIRGLLCRKCNLMLGHASDSKDILQKGIDYLEEHGLQGVVK